MPLESYEDGESDKKNTAGSEKPAAAICVYFSSRSFNLKELPKTPFPVKT